MSDTSPVAQTERKRKAGGAGKKGKTFMEDKSDLLSLVSGITATKAAAAQSKVDKIKPLIKPTPPPKTGGNKPLGGKGQKPPRAFGGVIPGGADKKKVSAGEKKRAERDKALADAKAAIIDKRRAKKARKHEREGGAGLAPEGGAATKPAKKVGFA